MSDAISTESTASREIEISRAFNAPRELVFAAFTDPEHMVKWWGPNGYSTTMGEMDARPGGVTRFIMHGPDGTDWPNRLVYSEVVRPERLAYAHDGDKDDDPQGFQVTVTFDEQDGGTLVTMRSIFRTAEARATVIKFGAVELGKQTLGKLAAYLETM